MALRDVTLVAAIAVVAACGGKFADDAGTGAGGAVGSGGSAGSGGELGTGGTGGAGTGGETGLGGSAGAGGGQESGGSGGFGGESADGGEDWFACNGPGQCTLVPTSCCGTSCEPVPLAEFTAVNTGHIGDFKKPCELVDCAPIACPAPPPGAPANQPFFTAVCRAGRCEAVDIRETELTACSDSTECYLRRGAECCESCGAGLSYGVVAFSKRADLRGELCSPMSGCDACAPAPFPTDLISTCNSNGHCDVAYTSAPTRQ
jgi:hypothetical protein